MILIVSIAPFDDGAGRIILQAVVASGDLTAKERLAVQR